MFGRREENAVEPMLLTGKEAAKVLSVSERTLYALAKAGELPAIRIGRAVRYDPLDLRAWIEQAKEKSRKAC